MRGAVVKTDTRVRHGGSPRRLFTSVYGRSSKRVRATNHRGIGVTKRRGTDATNRRDEPSSRTVVLKLGGELLEAQRMGDMARMIARAAKTTRLVVVHGGGKEIDAALAHASIPKRQVDGLRITDRATLEVVISVLAGSINTRFVAAINAAGAPAVGLTGADAGVGPVKPAPKHRATNGEFVDLGLVGEPVGEPDVPLVDVLSSRGYVPVIACIGASRGGGLFNVNADTLAARLATRLPAARLIIAGATPGVVDSEGRTIATIDGAAIDRLVGSGTATAGMVAKLRACRDAAGGRVGDVVIADGREPRRLTGLISGTGARHGRWTVVEGDPGGTKNEERRTKNGTKNKERRTRTKNRN
jgi:acetylglutamate kinase